MGVTGLGMAVVFVIYLAVCAIGIIGTIFIMRAVFSIPTIVKNSEAQTKLLSEIAKKQGVDPNVITAITQKLK